MEQSVLKAKVREQLGSAHSRRLRKSAWIPAVIYQEPSNALVAVPQKEVEMLLHHRGGRNAIIAMEFENSSLNTTVMIRDLQLEPVSGAVSHLDFVHISATEAVEMSVALEFLGEAAGVKAGGVLDQVLWELKISCLPADIPESIPVDVTALEIGDHLAAKDIVLDPKWTLEEDPEHIVVSVEAPRVEDEGSASDENAPAAPIVDSGKGKDVEED